MMSLYKNLFNYPFLLLVCLLLSCSEDEQERIYDSQIELATTHTREGQVSFLLDNGKIILPDTKIAYNLNENQRVRILFSIVQENPDIFEAIATIHSLALIPVFPVSKGPLSGNDSIDVESIWIGSHYLNFSFYVYADSKEHSIRLLQTKPIENDTIHFEIKHNANDDFPAYRKKGIVSFDIKELERYKPATLAITVDTYSGEKTYFRILN